VNEFACCTSVSSDLAYSSVQLTVASYLFITAVGSLDVTIMKTVQCSVSCPQVGGPKFFFARIAEWLACWTQAQKGLGSNRSRDAVG